MIVSERRTFITLRGYKYSFIYVPARDSKTTLLFLHGFPSQADDWERQVAHFAPLGYGVIAPDLLGHGDTSKPDALTSYTFKGMSDDIAQLLHHLKVESVVGVGHVDLRAASSLKHIPSHLALQPIDFNICQKGAVES
ncbi:hypothetical protein ARSEF4850_008670 [Beauveria asiatica]